MMYYIHYQSRGGANNMMLQGMLIFTLLTHLVLFTVVVLPNRQQSLFLRVLSGVLGIIPALLVANVVSYSASIMGMGTGGLVGGILRILGAMLRYSVRRNDPEPHSMYDSFMDNQYPDALIEQRWPNMIVVTGD